LDVEILEKIILEIEASKKSKMPEKKLKLPLNISKDFQKITKLKCYYYNKIGHLEAEYRKKQCSLRKKNPTIAYYEAKKHRKFLQNLFFGWFSELERRKLYLFLNFARIFHNNYYRWKQQLSKVNNK
jgi:hypothetical protein